MVKYRRRRRLTMNAPTTLVRRQDALRAARYGKSYVGAAAGRMSELDAAYHVGSFMLDNYRSAASRLKLGGAKQKALKQTAAKQRKYARNVMKGKGKGKGKANMNRHTENNRKSGKPSNKGNGYDSSRNGTIITHPSSRIPKWKKERLYKYKNSVWQTVLISKTSRLPNSANQLEGCRYPIRLPEAKEDRIQTCIFTPFCSHFSGTHTTFMSNVNAAATGLEHNTTYPFDVIQNKADQTMFLGNASSIEGNSAGAKPQHETGYTGTDATAALSGPSYTAANARGAANLKVVKSHIDQLVKSVKLDLVFTSSRSFPVEVSVSVIRRIKPSEPWILSTDDQRDICNSMDNKGMEWTEWRTEWCHKFILPALQVNKKPPQVSIQKLLKSNFLQTNSFKDNTTSQDYTEIYGSSAAELGRNLFHAHDEIADGAMSGNFYVLIKHRKKCVPQQFTYKQVIDMNRSDHAAGTAAVAEIELPVLSEESFDVPTHDGDGSGSTGSGETGASITGAPFITNQGDESKSSAYLVGKLTYEFGFRKEVESNPSLISNASSNVHYKKPLSLNIDPSLTGNDTNGFYTKSGNHQNTPQDTSE